MNQKTINSKIIDFGPLAFKVSSLNNECSKLAADRISLLYNSAQYTYFYKLKYEYSQVLSTLCFKARVYGYLSTQDLDLMRQCNDGIQFCQNKIIKYGISGSIDLLSLIITGISKLSKKDPNPYSAGTIRKFIRHAEIDNELFLLMKDERYREELKKNLRNYWLMTN